MVSRTKEISIQVSSISKPWDALPDEMKLEIFSYLSVVDIISSISLVCEDWHHLVQEHTLWMYLRLICDKDMSTEDIVRILKQTPMLRSIEFQWRTDTHLLIESLCRYCKNIRTVKLVCCGKIAHHTIENLVQEYPRLEVVSMKNCWAVQISCYSLFYNFANLKSINLSHCKMLSNIVLRNIIDSCQFLVEINLDYISDIMDGDLLYLITMRGETLISLTLFGDCLTDGSLYRLHECSKLRMLHITRSHGMTNCSLQSLYKLQNIRSLKLRYALKLTSSDLTNYLSAGAASKLEYLCLSRSKTFDDNVATTIASNCTQLRHLEILYCPNLTQVGRQYMWDGCRLLKTLNHSPLDFDSEVIVT